VEPSRAACCHHDEVATLRLSEGDGGLHGMAAHNADLDLSPSPYLGLGFSILNLASSRRCRGSPPEGAGTRKDVGVWERVVQDRQQGDTRPNGRSAQLKRKTERARRKIREFHRQEVPGEHLAPPPIVLLQDNVGAAPA